jgi:hypothetical protein
LKKLFFLPFLEGKKCLGSLGLAGLDNIRNNGRVVEWRVPGWFAGWNREEGLEVGLGRNEV